MEKTKAESIGGIAGAIGGGLGGWIGSSMDLHPALTGLLAAILVIVMGGIVKFIWK